MAFQESWVEKQIREAQERGEFDNLPGAGESLLDVRTDDGVREVLRNYNLRVLDDRRRPPLGKESPIWAPTVDVEPMVERWWQRHRS